MIFMQFQSFAVLLVALGFVGVSASFSNIGTLQKPSFNSRVAALPQEVDPPNALMCSHWMSPHDCLKSLRVDFRMGLSTKDAQLRQSRTGMNVLSKPREKSLFHLIVEQFNNTLVLVLLGVAAISSGFAIIERDGEAFTEPAVISLILLLNAFVGVWQTKSAEYSLEALKKLQPERCTVLRDGVWNNDFPSEQLVPGDIIHLRVGDKVPADARILVIKGNALCTDEGSLTGESTTVSKCVTEVASDSPITGKMNMVFAGTMVTTGICYAMVTSIGDSTEIGAINKGVQLAADTEMKTPLTTKLDMFGNQLSKIIGAICALVWLSSVPKFSNPMHKNWLAGAVHHGKVAVALGVAAIPEGLPAIITLCLSLGTRRMANRNVIVRKLSSIETLGCTSVICTDKTGTLTTNKMTVQNLVTVASGGGDTAQRMRDYPVDGVTFAPEGRVHGLRANSMMTPTLQMIATIAALCNEAKIEFRDGQYERVGEPTEAALKVLVEKLGVFNLARDNRPDVLAHQCSDYWAAKYTTLALLEFNRDRKSMSVLVREKQDDGMRAAEGKVDNMLLVKGACEVLLTRCNRVQTESGEVVPLTAALRAEIMRKFNDMASVPQRVIGLAYKQGAELGELNTFTDPAAAQKSEILSKSENFATIEKDLVFVGMCGIKDPARKEAAEAILRCREAGIRVMMITGDSKETAVAIAKEVNIFDKSATLEALSGRHAFTGKEFMSLPEKSQLEVLRSGNKVFCRTEPRDKQRLISMLSRLGEIPAMTGDGVNDAPALKQAAIGVAMGITGTEVAKGAADMVITDDNFATIVNAVEEGRNIYANIQTFVSFLVSCNIGEVLVVVLGALLGLPELLSPLHLLWMNFVTDGPPAIALGFNPSDPKVMQRRPRSLREEIMSGPLLLRNVITGTYISAATIGAYIWWFQSKHVGWRQLLSWQNCASWRNFIHSADAPSWPIEPCNIFNPKLQYKPQTIAISVMVMAQLLKALTSVSLDQSLLSIPARRNPLLLAGVILPLLLHLMVMYVPSIAAVFRLAPLKWSDWQVILAFSLPILLVEELSKKFIRSSENKASAQQ